MKNTFFFFSSRRRHTRSKRDWSSDVCSSDLGLITIERDRVYAWHWFRATTTSSVQHIALPDGLEGNGYVSVSFVRDVNSDEVFTSPLSYGVAPFSVSLDRRKAAITLAAPDLVKPGDPFKIHYSTDRPS